MREEFVQQVEDCISLVRNREFRDLGQTPLAEHLQSILRKRLTSPLPDCSPVIIGEALRETFEEAIESMRPDDMEKDTPQRQRFVYLKEYVLHGEAWEPVAYDDLKVSRSKLYDIRRDALDVLAKTLWHLEEELKMSKEVFCNLGRPPYVNFIPRYTPKGQRYVEDILIPELRTGRAWIIAIRGQPGVGKSCLAYATAEKCVEEIKESHLPFDAVIWIPCRPQEFRPTKDVVRVHSNPTSMSQIYETVGKTLQNREVLQCSEEEKHDIVHNLLTVHNCLFVVDNADSEWLPKELLDEIEAFLQEIPVPHKALVTMRATQEWEGQRSIKLESMTKKELRELMLQDTRGLMGFTESEFCQVYEKTYGNPLALKQALSLTRAFGYSLDEALAFDKYSPEMLDFMYERAFVRLPPDAKKMLVLLPLFADPAPSEALEYASNVSGPNKVKALGWLYRGHMIEKVREEQTYEDNSRYTLLPFAREFLRNIRRDKETEINNLTVAQYVKEAYPRLAEYYQILLKNTADRLDDMLMILKADLENISNLMEWCWNNNLEMLVDYLDAIGIPLGILRYLKRREKWGRRVVDSCRELGRLEEADWYLIRDVAWTLVKMGAEETRTEARALLEEARVRAEEGSWVRNLALVLRNLGTLAIDDDDFEKAQEYLTTSVELWKKVDEPFFQMITRQAQANLARKRKNLEEAKEIYEDLFNRYQEIGDINGMIQVQAELALVAAQEGDVDKACRLSNEALIWANTIEYPAHSLGYVLRRHSQMQEMWNNLETSISQAEEASEVFKALGMSYHVDKLQARIKDLKERVDSENPTQ